MNTEISEKELVQLPPFPHIRRLYRSSDPTLHFGHAHIWWFVILPAIDRLRVLPLKQNLPAVIEMCPLKIGVST